MATLIQSTAVLAFARVTNTALQFLSPVLLVRLLDPETFGRYREFIAWAMVTTSITAFSISSNLLYFVPRHPENARKYVSHTNWATLITALFAAVVLWIFQGPIRAGTSYDFLVPLALYTVLYNSMSYVDTYWIATKQPKYVFWYSTLRTATRLCAVVAAAWITRSIEGILVALVAVELLRMLAVLIVAYSSGLLSFGFDRKMAREQMGFVAPLGVATSLGRLNQYIGQIIISSQLGAAALALYAVASIKVPVIRIVRGAVSEAIFPDMVRQAASDHPDRLRLWKRGNIAYTFAVLPAFFLLFWYADILVPLVFTEHYAGAVPIFRILLLLMPLGTIELNSPLRAVKRTGEMLAGSVLLLVVNLLCIVIFFRWLPEQALLGPAIGMVAGQIVQLIFMSWRVVRCFDTTLGELLKWRSQSVIWACTLGCGVILLAGEYVPMPPLWRVATFSLLYLGAYVLALRPFRIEEVERLLRAVNRRLHRAPA